MLNLARIPGVSFEIKHVDSRSGLRQCKLVGIHGEVGAAVAVRLQPFVLLLDRRRASSIGEKGHSTPPQ